ncbi:MAG: 50S ribosomal protein L22 [Clostridia bacterium]|jgi:large subunit ribosomal protein L22|nr:50S ribosomal protein L22 [Clostridia bacterium]MBT7121765.1 50S ribosomal protein L22 [Clostridia bacterium]
MATRQREKAQARQENKDKRPSAKVKYIRISSSKVKLVIDLIRGKNVAEAIAILKNTQKAASPVIEKLLNSAIANAESTKGLLRDDLFVAEVFADQGPTLKRFRPRAQGRASRIRKRTSHITIILDSAVKEEA